MNKCNPPQTPYLQTPKPQKPVSSPYSFRHRASLTVRGKLSSDTLTDSSSDSDYEDCTATDRTYELSSDDGDGSIYSDELFKCLPGANQLPEVVVSISECNSQIFLML